MNIGDMVIRAHAGSTITPGIIVDVEKETVNFDGGVEGPRSYEEIRFVVAWSDGTQTSQLDVELDELETLNKIPS
jgi:hypothetical protein